MAGLFRGVDGSLMAEAVEDAEGERGVPQDLYIVNCQLRNHSGASSPLVHRDGNTASVIGAMLRSSA